MQSYSENEYESPTLQLAITVLQGAILLPSQMRQTVTMTLENLVPKAGTPRRGRNTKFAETKTIVTSTTKPKTICALRKRF